MRMSARNILALSLPFQFLAVWILGFFPETVEHWYSRGLYPWISQLMRYSLGWIPFSVGDLFYTVLILLSIRFLWIKTSKTKQTPTLVLRDVGAALATLYLAFNLLWGLNYHRLPLHETLNLTDEYEEAALYSFTERLITYSNSLQLELAGDSVKAVKIPYNEYEMHRMTPIGFESLQREFSHLEYHPQSIKASLYSKPLSYMGYSGYLNPFTLEAQVNNSQLDFKYPAVSSHEAAHQLGYSAENEANFIAFLACLRHPDPYFRYSGAIYALRYCLNDIGRRDPVYYEKIRATVHPGIFENYKEVQEFWERHENPLEPIFKTIFDYFLKANRQKEGIDSYNYVVSLLVNYFEIHSL